jgi:hypothetical protein
MLLKKLILFIIITNVFLYYCSPTEPDESVSVSEISVDMSSITVIDTVTLECSASSSGSLHYHWMPMKENTIYTSSVLDRANSSGSFDHGKWIKWNPPSAGTWTIEVMVYLKSADHSSLTSSNGEIHYEYDQYGQVSREHCFLSEERGELWDKISTSLQVSNYSKFSFTKHILENNFTWAYGVNTADIDGDGDTDILGTAEMAGKIAWWENLGSGNFSKHTLDENFNGATSVCAIDIDDDGDLDVIGSGDNDNIAWWENSGADNFTKHMIDTYHGAEQICALDLDDDNDVDIVGAMQMDGEIAWWENNGIQEFTKQSINDAFNDASAVHTADINNDGYIDIVGAATYGKEIAWWENNGDKSFVQHVINNNSAWPTSVMAVDIDGDNDMDIITAESLTSEGGIVCYENNGLNSFTKFSIDNNIASANSIYAIDMDKDGDIDIVAALDIIKGEISWWENKGSNNFVKNTIDADFDNANFVHSADIDGDGDADVVGTARFGSEICWWESKKIP